MTPDVTLKLTIEAKADKEEPIQDELKKGVLPEIEKPIPPEDTIEKIEMKPEREILPDLVKEPIEEVKEEIPTMVDERSKMEEPVFTEIIPEVEKKDEVELIIEPPTLVPDNVDVIFEKPKEKITEDADVPIKEPEIADDKFAVPTKVEKIEKDIPLDDGIKEKKDLEDETKIILPVPKLIDEKEKEDDDEKDEILKKKEDIELTDDIDKDITEGVVELEEKLEEIELEQVVPPVREGLDVEDKIIEELEDEATEGERKADVDEVKVEELKPEVIPEPEIEGEEETIEPLLKIKSEEEDLPFEEEDVERIEVTDKIPVEYKPEDMEEIKEIEVEEEIAKVEPEEVAKVEPEEVIKVEPEEVVKEIKIEPMDEIKIIEKVEPIEEIEEIPVKLIEEVIEPSLIPVIKEEEKEEIKEKPKIPIDPRIVPTPYLAVADIEEIKKEPSVDVVIKKEMIPSVCKRPEKIMVNRYY